MEVVPSLGDLSSTIVQRAFTGGSLVVARSTAADVGQSTISFGKSILELAERVGGSVTRCDTSCVQPAKGRQAAVVEDGSLKELNDFLMLNILRAVARHIEGREASSVLAELMFIELMVWSSLVDPIFVHPCQKVKFTKCLNERLDAGALVRWDDGTVGQRVSGVRRRLSIVLSREIAVLGVRAFGESQRGPYERGGCRIPLQKSGHSPCSVQSLAGSN
jgi:hypothetical protein